jgi:hypothetical protein
MTYPEFKEGSDDGKEPKYENGQNVNDKEQPRYLGCSLSFYGTSEREWCASSRVSGYCASSMVGLLGCP